MRANLVLPILCFSLFPSAGRADPIHDAIEKDDLAKVKALVQADPKCVDACRPSKGEPAHPFHIAVDLGRTKIAKYLLLHGVSIETWGQQALRIATWQKRGDMVEMLLKKGARVDIFSAIGLGRVDEIKRMLKSDPKLTITSESDSNVWERKDPLRWAAYMGHENIVKLLLEHKAEVSENVAGWSGQFHGPLYYAVLGGNIRVVGQLIDQKTPVDGSLCQETPLISAIRGRKTDIADLLLRSGANVDARIEIPDIRNQIFPFDEGMDPFPPKCYCPIHVAAEIGDPDIVRLLIKHRVKVAVKDSDGKTPLELAKDKMVKKLLLNAGAK